MKLFITWIIGAAALIVFVCLVCWHCCERKTKRTDKKMLYWIADTEIRRFVALLVLVAIGLFFGGIFSYCDVPKKLIPPSVSNGNGWSNLYNSLLGLTIALPVFVGLWFFRTIDTREQIAKTQEQIKKTHLQIDQSFLLDAKKAFLSGNNFKERTTAFIQLVQFQKQNLFKKEIKIIFKGSGLTKSNDKTGKRKIF